MNCRIREGALPLCPQWRGRGKNCLLKHLGEKKIVLLLRKNLPGMPEKAKEPGRRASLPLWREKLR